MNRDGNLDLAVANARSNDVSVLLGTGTGSFGTATNFGVGASPESVAIADLNGDGNLDLATTNQESNNVSVLLGTGTGSFGTATNFGVGNNPYDLAIADLNGDGKLDLAIANSVSNNVSVLLGTGTGSFGTATNFGVGSGPESVAIVDLNGDGNLDLAAANRFSNNVSVLLGTGTGSFGAATNFGVGGGPVELAIADLNGDGKLDLATANGFSDSVSVLLNTSTPNSAPVNAVPAAQTTNEDTPLVFSSANGNALSITDDSTSLTTTVSVTSGTGSLSATTGGGATITNNGSRSVTLSGTTTQINAALAGLTYTATANANGTAYTTLTLTTTDGSLTDTDTVTINVNAVNDAPTATGETLTDIAEDSGVRTISFASLLSNDSAGPANESSQTLTITAVSNAVGGTAIINGTNIEFTPTANYNGPASFQYTIQDNGTTSGIADPKTANATASFNITSVNDAPTATGETLTDIAEDSGVRTISFASLLSNDSAGPANESSQTLTITAVSNVVGGTAIINGTNIEFTPTANYNGPASFQYTIQDNGTTSGIADPKTANATASFSITPVNDAPVVAQALADQSSPEDAAVSFTIPANSFSDVDNSTLTLSATLANDTPLPSWLSFNAATRTFSGTPPLNFNGTLALKVTASDGALSVSDTFDLVITPVNDAPVVANLLSDQSSPEDTAVSFTIPANSFSDVDNSTLTLSATLANDTPLPSWLSFNAATRTFSGTPPLNFNGTLSIKVTASDGSLPVSDTFDLVITPVNDAPTIAAPTSVRVQSGGTAISGISIADVDAGTGTLTTTLSVTNGSLNLTNLNGATATGLNTGSVTLTGTLTQINAALATLRYSGSTFSGNTNLTVRVNDNGNVGSGGAKTTTQTIALQVARDLGNLSKKEIEVQGTVSSSDPVDRYQFTLTQATTKFKLTLGDLAANADVYILNSNGTVVASSTNAGNRSEVLNNLSLLAGTYFIEVRQVSGNTKYELEVEAL